VPPSALSLTTTASVLPARFGWTGLAVGKDGEIVSPTI
jgi:hypothetical protein